MKREFMESDKESNEGKDHKEEMQVKGQCRRSEKCNQDG